MAPESGDPFPPGSPDTWLPVPPLALWLGASAPLSEAVSPCVTGGDSPTPKAAPSPLQVPREALHRGPERETSGGVWGGSREPDKALLAGWGSLRNRELLGQSRPGESKQRLAPLLHDPGLCPESSCAPRGRSGLAWRPPGRRTDWPAARAAAGQARSGPRRADKACQGAHDLRLRTPARAGAPNRAGEAGTHLALLSFRDPRAAAQAAPLNLAFARPDQLPAAPNPPLPTFCP